MVPLLICTLPYAGLFFSASATSCELRSASKTNTICALPRVPLHQHTRCSAKLEACRYEHRNVTRPFLMYASAFLGQTSVAPYAPDYPPQPCHWYLSPRQPQYWTATTSWQVPSWSPLEIRGQSLSTSRSTSTSPPSPPRRPRRAELAARARVPECPRRANFGVCVRAWRHTDARSC